MTQKEFAERLDIHQPSLSDYENGKSAPRKSTIRHILEKFPEVNPLFLVGKSETMINNNVEENWATFERMHFVGKNQLYAGQKHLEGDYGAIYVGDDLEEAFATISGIEKKYKIELERIDELEVENKLLRLSINEKKLSLQFADTLVKNLQQQVESLQNQLNNLKSNKEKHHNY